MYRYSNGQISLADFKQPVTTNLKECNRWGEESPNKFLVKSTPMWMSNGLWPWCLI